MKSTQRVQLTLGFVAFPTLAERPSVKSHHDAGRKALRLALANRGIVGTVTANPELGYLQLTQSDTSPIPGIFINVSHTDGLAVGALSPAPVGVDVEATGRDPSKALERLMSERDRENLAKFPKPLDARLSPALILWTAKEAFAKAMGVGMKIGMPDLEIDFWGPLPYQARTSKAGHFKLQNPCIHWEIRGNFLVTLCTEAAVLAQGIERVSG